MTETGGAGRGGGEDTFEALRSMLATMLGGAGLVSGQLARAPAIAEISRATALLRQAVALDVAATATQARAGVAFVRVTRHTASVAFTLGRHAPRLVRACRR